MNRTTAIIWAITVLGCGGEKTSAIARPTTQPATATRGVRPAIETRWDDSLGVLLATLSFENGTPVLFLRDSASTGDLEVELFNHEGRTARAKLGQLTSRRGCPWEHAAVLAPSTSSATPPVWSLALAPGVATPIAIEGIGDLLPRDSASLAAQIHRLVSAVPDDSSSAPFRGVPIVVRDAWRFQLGDSTLVAVAVATRGINVESNPRGEVTTILMEREPGAGSGEWHTGFARRSSGSEDRVEGADLLAAFLLHRARSAVALAREGETGLVLDIVERTAPGTWRLRWSSAALPCAR